MSGCQKNQAEDEGYVAISVDIEGDVCVRRYTRDELKAELDAGDFEDAEFLDESDTGDLRDPQHWPIPGNKGLCVMLVRGRVVVPVAKTRTVTYDI